MICSRRLLDDAYRALYQLFVLRPDIHHQRAVHIAQPRHRTGGDHVQDHLVCGARFHARRPSQDLRADLSHDGKFRGTFQRRIAIAGERDRARSATAGIFDRGNGEWSASTGGDADDYVVPAGFLLLHLLHSHRLVVFAGLGRRS